MRRVSRRSRNRCTRLIWMCFFVGDLNIHVIDWYVSYNLKSPMINLWKEEIFPGINGVGWKIGQYVAINLNFKFLAPILRLGLINNRRLFLSIPRYLLLPIPVHCTSHPWNQWPTNICDTISNILCIFIFCSTSLHHHHYHHTSSSPSQSLSSLGIIILWQVLVMSVKIWLILRRRRSHQPYLV